MLSEEGACYPHRNNLLQERKRKRNQETKIIEKGKIDPKRKRNQMARFSGVIGIQINLMYRERPVIWSVELEYYRVVTAIAPPERQTIEIKAKNKTKNAN